MELKGKRVLVIGERDGVNAPAIEACVKTVIDGLAFAKAPATTTFTIKP